ncbi:MAG: formylmethanofuran dehydrogenase subunit A [Gemmataceae bacterium]|nr:formylmethanofuran dehydrogenase subunit A [Gemmataceae bacterium]
MLVKIQSGTVVDPAHANSGGIRDVWLRHGKVVGPTDDPPDRLIDASGLVVMAGGVDMHTHIAGPKVNAARGLRPDDRRAARPVRRTESRRSGTAGSVPSTFATGALYAGLGYTTAVDAAVPPTGARHAHFEFADTPVVDAGMLLTLGDHLYALEQIAARETERLRHFIGWVLGATRGYGVKLVNPGGVEAYKCGVNQCGLDQPVAPFDLTPRQVLAAMAAAVDELNLPHPAHIHCADLGRPGNWRTTLASMQAVEGRRAHFTHVQFHSYGGGPDEPFCSRARDLAEYVNSHPNITVDVGQVLFGETTAMTGDSAVGYFLARATGRRWVDHDSECEAGCGIVPVSYREASLVNAVQWAAGLEWFLLVNDPWRIALTTDHPNGASFEAYPEIIQLLMSRDARREALERLPAAVRERTVLGDLSREYTLDEIAIITRAAPARILGLRAKGHLGIGADADVAVYTPGDDRRAMFTLPRYLLKRGELVVENGELRQSVFGPRLCHAPEFDRGELPGIKDWCERHYSMQFANLYVE